MKREDVLRKGPYPLLIDGKEVPSLSGKTFTSIDPSTGRALAEVLTRRALAEVMA